MYMRLKLSKVYLRVIGTCFYGEAREAAGILSICVNFTCFSFVMAYNNKKKLVPYLDVISLFVSKPSTFNYINSQFLEISGFHRIDFVRFGDKGILGIYSVFHKEVVVFFFADNSEIKNYSDRYYDILHPVVRI